MSAFPAFAIPPPELTPQSRTDDFGLARLYNLSTRKLPYDGIAWATADPLGPNTAFNSFMTEANNWFVNGWSSVQFDDPVDFSLINTPGEAWPFRTSA